MRQERPIPLTPAMEKAVNELKGTISERFPQASFVVEEGFDPKGVYLVTTVDIADTDEVIDLIVRETGDCRLVCSSAHTVQGTSRVNDRQRCTGVNA